MACLFASRNIINAQDKIKPPHMERFFHCKFNRFLKIRFVSQKSKPPTAA